MLYYTLGSDFIKGIVQNEHARSMWVQSNQIGDWNADFSLPSLCQPTHVH